MPKRDGASAVGAGWLPEPAPAPTAEEHLALIVERAPTEPLTAVYVWFEPDPEDPAGDFETKVRHSRLLDLDTGEVLAAFARATGYKELGAYIRAPVGAGGLGLGYVAPPPSSEEDRRSDYNAQRARVGYPPITYPTAGCSRATWFRLTDSIVPQLLDWRRRHLK